MYREKLRNKLVESIHPLDSKYCVSSKTSVTPSNWRVTSAQCNTSPLQSLYSDTRRFFPTVVDWIQIQSTTVGPSWTWLDAGYSKQNTGTSDVAKWCSTCTRLSWSWLSVRVRTVDLLGVLVFHLGFLALSSANVKVAMTALIATGSLLNSIQ